MLGTTFSIWVGWAADVVRCVCLLALERFKFEYLTVFDHFFFSSANATYMMSYFFYQNVPPNPEKT